MFGSHSAKEKCFTTSKIPAWKTLLQKWKSFFKYVFTMKWWTWKHKPTHQKIPTCLKDKGRHPRYLVCPGHITSKHDGDVHYIGARQLMRLYGVGPRDCIVCGLSRPEGYYGISDEKLLGLIKLRPQYDGDYLLESATKQPTKGGTHGYSFNAVHE